MLLADLAATHLTKMAARGYADPTLRQYDLAQRRFLVFLSAQLDRPPTLADLTLERAEAFQIALYADKLTNRTVCSYTVMLRSWAAWIATYVSEVFAGKNPLADMKPPKPEKTVPDRLSTQEIYALLGACQQTHYAARNVSIILLLWDSGLRVSELAALRRRDVRLAEGGQLGRVHVRQGKGGKERWSGLGEVTSDALAAYLKTRLGKDLQPDDCLFRGRLETRLHERGIRAMLRNLATVAGVDPERCHPHAFRHTFGRGQVRIGTSTLVLQEFLGHEKPTMTAHYARLEAADVEGSFVSLVDHARATANALPKRGSGRRS